MRGEIRRIAQRLRSLRHSGEQEAGLLTFAAGAIYSLATVSDSHSQRRQDKGAVARVQEAKVALGEIASQAVPKHSLWIEETHFNGAVWRVDVLFERIVRCHTGKRNILERSELEDAARQSGMPMEHFRKWKRVRNDCNALKHMNPRAIVGRRIPMRAWVAALEDAASLIEWVFARRHL